MKGKKGKNNRDKADECFIFGVYFYEFGELSRAVSEFTKAIKFDPGFIMAYIHRGLAKDSLNNYQGAIKDYTKAIKMIRSLSNENKVLHSILVKLYNARGIAQKKIKKYKDAIADFTKAIKLNPNNSSSYDNRGNAKLSLGDYKGAIIDFTKAIELNPNNIFAYINRGGAKKFLGDYKGALADFAKADKIEPFAATCYNRAKIYSEMGRYLDAIIEAGKARNLGLEPALYNELLQFIELGEK